MFLSIIIPAHNAERTLVRAVRSVLNQSLCKNYEIIIINDVSTDNTYSLAREVAETHENIKVVQNPWSMGRGASLNRGLDLSCGRYVTFLDADDWLRSDAFERFLLATKDSPEIVFCDVNAITDYGFPAISGSIMYRHDVKNIQKEVFRAALTFLAFGAIFQKHFLDVNKIRFTPCHFYADIEFVVNGVISAQTVIILNQTLYYRAARHSPSPATSAQEIDDAVEAWEKVYRQLGTKKKFRRYFTEWRDGVSNFIALITDKILRYSPGNIDLLRKKIENSTVFKKENITGDLLSRLLERPSDIGPPRMGMENFHTLAEAADGAVVFIANIDYHLRHLVPIARQLVQTGIKCVVFDISSSSIFPPNRHLKATEAANWNDIPLFSFDLSEIYPFFLRAKAYIFTSDWGELRPLLFHLKQCGVPTINFYEGIHDDFLMEAPAPPTVKELPYRHADWLLLPGLYYESIYSNYKTVVVGLPSIHSKLTESPSFPTIPSALINVNFSYEVLEDKRRIFLNTAVKACEELGVNLIISQHPVDRARLSNIKVSNLDIYEEIRRNSFVISRFSTCILEALAMGKPVIYHNPHKEKFPKFQENPMGAFQVSDSVESLKAAIQNVLLDIEAKTDFRRRASSFLHSHANIFADSPPEIYAAQAITQIIETDAKNYTPRAARYIPPAGCGPASEADLYSRLGNAYLKAPKWKRALMMFLADRRWFQESLIDALKKISS